MKHLLSCFLLLALPIHASADEADDPFAELLAPRGHSKEPEIMAMDEAWLEYSKGMDQLKVAYRANFAKALKHADGAEIFLLSFTMERDVLEKKQGDYIHINPYGKYSKILKRRKLQGKNLEELRDATAKLLQEKSTNGGAFCHFPIHGIRLTRGKRVIFETSLCWKCANYFICYPYEETASWVGFHGTAMKKFLDREMPIPQSEIDRFNAKFGKKKKR